MSILRLKRSIRYWWSATKAYTHPISPFAIKQRETLFYRTIEAISVYTQSGIVLDVGTGTGKLLGILTRVAPELTCVGADLNRVLLQEAQVRSLEKQTSDRLFFLQANVEALPFKNESINLIVSFASLHQWKNRQSSVAEIYRVLKVGGVAIILVGTGLMWIFDLLNGKLSNCRNLKTLFGLAGFKDIVVEVVGITETLPRGNQSVFLIVGRK